jgi:hypothetical protein
MAIHRSASSKAKLAAEPVLSTEISPVDPPRRGREKAEIHKNPDHRIKVRPIDRLGSVRTAGQTAEQAGVFARLPGEGVPPKDEILSWEPFRGGCRGTRHRESEGVLLDMEVHEGPLGRRSTGGSDQHLLATVPPPDQTWSRWCVTKNGVRAQRQLLGNRRFVCHPERAVARNGPVITARGLRARRRRFRRPRA